MLTEGIWQQRGQWWWQCGVVHPTATRWAGGTWPEWVSQGKGRRMGGPSACIRPALLHSTLLWPCHQRWEGACVPLFHFEKVILALGCSRDRACWCKVKGRVGGVEGQAGGTDFGVGGAADRRKVGRGPNAAGGRHNEG